MIGFFKGLKRDEAERKQNGELAMKEGKNKMTYDLFYYISQQLHKEGKTEFAFESNMSWNLMCRQYNVTTLNAQAFGVYMDAITVEYGKDKTHGTGGNQNKSVMLKHVYANPFMPEVSTNTYRPPVRPSARPPARPPVRPHVRPSARRFAHSLLWG